MAADETLHVNHKHKHLGLKRELGLFTTTMAGIGIIVGAGIYALIGLAAGTAGNALWLSFVISAIAAIFTGLSYAELSSRFPRDSGEAAYAQEAFGTRIAFLTGYLVIVSGVISAAAVALGFSGYFAALFKTNIALPIIAIAVIALLSVINFFGIKQSARLNVILTFLEIFGLVLVIIIGLRFFGNVNYFEMPEGLTGVFSASALIFFAFLGFESIVKFSEETKDPKRTIPKALLLSLLISTVLYILVGIAAVSALGWEALSASRAPLADVAAAAFGSNTFILLAIIALCSTANTILIILVSTSRIIYGMSNDDSLPKIFSKIHLTQRTPWIAILATFIISAAFALLGNLGLVAEITNFAIFITFIIINSALIYLRYHAPTAKGFKVPLSIGKFPVLPLLGILSAIFMLSYLQPRVLFGGLIITGLGLIIYELINRRY